MASTALPELPPCAPDTSCSLHPWLVFGAALRELPQRRHFAATFPHPCPMPSAPQAPHPLCGEGETPLPPPRANEVVTTTQKKSKTHKNHPRHPSAPAEGESGSPSMAAALPGRAAAMAAGGRRAVYPLFQLGGPQLRIFRPNFFMLAVRPGVPQPEDTVQFRVSMEMTKVDIKNYLEKIYNVPVAAVRTRIQYGANNKRNHKNQRVKTPDYKVAYVQLGKGQTFQFPNLFPEKEQDEEAQSFDDFRKKYLEKEQKIQKGDPRRGGVPDWFGL
uniref:Large ribosomal subunit protein uL23m n=4 Tax=Anatidae TaxID=8830 RepID=A0A8B9V0J0_9AVES